MSLRLSAHASRYAPQFVLLFSLAAPACGEPAEPAGSESLASTGSVGTQAGPATPVATVPAVTATPTVAPTQAPATASAPSASTPMLPTQPPTEEPAATAAVPTTPPEEPNEPPPEQPNEPPQMESEPEGPEEPEAEPEQPEEEPEQPEEPEEPEAEPEQPEEEPEQPEEEPEQPEVQPPEDDGNVIQGQGGTVEATIVVRAGEIFDGGGQTFIAGSALGDGSQDEGQDPVFRLEDGAQLRNVVIGSPAADGIHCYGDVTLQNIEWLDIGEDALTIKESGTVTLDGGSAVNGEDKVFQINAASTFIVKNFTARSAGKFIRQNGDTTFRVDVVIENCDISQMDESIFRTDSDSSTVSMTNTRYSDIGDELFLGVNPGNITQSNNTEY